MSTDLDETAEMEKEVKSIIYKDIKESKLDDIYPTEFDRTVFKEH